MSLWKRPTRSWRRCPHARLLGVYGDEIILTRGRRLICADCWRTLDGPVSLANVGITLPPTVGPKGGAGNSGASDR